MRCSGIKRIVSILTAILLLALLLTSCAKQPAEQESENTAEPGASAPAVADNTPSAFTAAPDETAPPAESAPPAEATSVPSVEKTAVVVYFSATGNTKMLAERIAALADADIKEIIPAQAYTGEDLNYHDSSTRASAEQNDASARPAIAEDISLEGYTTIILGYPIWWGQAPRILNTFVEAHDLTGITVIPFCTSGSSDIGTSADNLAALAGSGTWVQGKRFAVSVSEAELRSWITDVLAGR